MIKSSSHDLDEIPRLAQIRVSSQDSPLSTIMLDEISFIKDPNPSDVSPRELFQFLSTTMYHSFYFDLFDKESTPKIVSNSLDSCLANEYCD